MYTKHLQRIAFTLPLIITLLTTDSSSQTQCNFKIKLDAKPYNHIGDFDIMEADAEGKTDTKIQFTIQEVKTSSPKILFTKTLSLLDIYNKSEFSVDLPCSNENLLAIFICQDKNNSGNCINKLWTDMNTASKDLGMVIKVESPFIGRNITFRRKSQNATPEKVYLFNAFSLNNGEIKLIDPSQENSDIKASKEDLAYAKKINSKIGSYPANISNKEIIINIPFAKNYDPLIP